MMDDLTLYDLRPGEKASVSGMDIRGSMRRRLRDVGFLDGAEVVCAFRARSGEPAAFFVCGALIALREEEMRAITATGRAACTAWR